jgi:hypothetical protein
MNSKGAAMMHSFFISQPAQSKLSQPDAAASGSAPHKHLPTMPMAASAVTVTPEIFNGYLSDLSDSSDVELGSDGSSDYDPDPINLPGPPVAGQTNMKTQAQQPPPLKRQRLQVPAHIARSQAQDERQKKMKQGLEDIEKLIQSKKDVFDAGHNGLQSYRACAIQSYLWMVVHNGKSTIEASQRAAESQGFAEKWGGRMVRCWVRKWVEERKLPISSKGRHKKVFSLYDDPAIRAELRSFVRSNKWAMNTEKLVAFTKQEMVPAAAKEYLEHITNVEIPQGLKKYLEIELFPRIQLKSNKGVSLSTARRLLKHEGFQFQEYKKALYFDGHERPDVVQDRQTRFLPEMVRLKERLVEYVAGDVEKEMLKTPTNYVERRLVLCAHDEMTAQANNDAGKGWILEGEQPLRKKGAGRGIHQSDIICSTIGWLRDASQTLGCGKNYEGYWNGELFVKQVWSIWSIF